MLRVGLSCVAAYLCICGGVNHFFCVATTGFATLTSITMCTIEIACRVCDSLHQVVGGQHINLRPMASEHFNRKTMVPATSPALLLLCGDMRCYRLLETPLDAHLKVPNPKAQCINMASVVVTLSQCRNLVRRHRTGAINSGVEEYYLSGKKQENNMHNRSNSYASDNK